MEKINKTEFVEGLIFYNGCQWTKEHLEEIVSNFDKVNAHYVEIYDDKADFFIERLETDEEFEKRKKFWADKKEEGRKSRYEQYLKLKKEFEDGIN